MPPLSLVEPARARKLTIVEREHIAQGLGAEKSIRQIAKELGRHPSTVLRELRKNMHHQQYRRRAGTGFPAQPPWKYSPHQAQLRADKKASRPKQAKLAANPRLRAEVQDRLEHKHSPEQIARRLVTDFPHDAEMRVSHETIYQSLYVQGRGALNRELTRHLRTGRALRKPRRRTQGWFVCKRSRRCRRTLRWLRRPTRPRRSRSNDAEASSCRNLPWLM